MSSISEREIEDVNGRLASLERILQSVVNTKTQNATESSPSSHPEVLSTPRDSQLMERDLVFEGDSSFVAHSKHVTQAFETSLNNSPFSNSVRDVSAAVATLRSFLNESPATTDASHPLQRPLQEVIHYPELSHLSTPPMEAVLRILRYFKGIFPLPSAAVLDLE